MGLVFSPPSRSEAPRRMKQRGICSDQILTSSRSRRMSYLLRASLLFQWAQLTYKPNMIPRRKSWASPRAHSLSNITHQGPSLNWRCMVLRGANDQYKDPLLLALRSFPEPLKASTRRPYGACYSHATYSWISRSS